MQQRRSKVTEAKLVAIFSPSDMKGTDDEVEGCDRRNAAKRPREKGGEREGEEDGDGERDHKKQRQGEARRGKERWQEWETEMTWRKDFGLSPQ
jgi:hypothetical protein